MKSTAERLRELMNQTGWRQIDILEKCKPYCDKYHIKIGKSDLSQYISGKTRPGQSKLTVLSMALGVSEGWLMGLEVSQKRDTTPEGSGVKVDPVDLQLADLITKLTPDQKQEVLHYLQYLVSKK